jgi:hypothetical protein
MKEMRLTDAKTGEKLSNFQSFAQGDLIIADRAYGTIAGIEYLRERGSDFLVRYRTGAFKLYTKEHERVEVTDFFAELKPEACGEVTLYYHLKGEYKPVRFCAIRKTEDAEARGVERLNRALKRLAVCCTSSQNRIFKQLIAKIYSLNV